MRIKNIEARLSKKLMAWTKTLPDELRDRVRATAMVAGGAIASMLNNKEPHDYDIYLTNGDVLKDLITHYINKFCEDPPARFVNTKVSGVSLWMNHQDTAYERWWMKVHEEREDTSTMPEIIHPRYKVFIRSAGVASNEEEQERYNYFEQCGDNHTTLYMQSIRDRSNDDPKENARTQLLNDTLNELAEAATEDSDDTEEVEIGAASKRGLLRDKYVPVFLTDNCISLSGGVQIVCRFYGEREYILDSFDFLHTKQTYSLKGGLQLWQPALESLLTGELRYTGSYYPVCSLFRLRKFLARGMTVSAGTILQIAMDVAELDLMQIPVLYEQLIGVDAAYFVDFLSRLHAVKKENPDFCFDKSYLMQLVDEVFNEAAEQTE